MIYSAGLITLGPAAVVLAALESRVHCRRLGVPTVGIQIRNQKLDLRLVKSIQAAEIYTDHNSLESRAASTTAAGPKVIKPAK